MCLQQVVLSAWWWPVFQQSQSWRRNPTLSLPAVRSALQSSAQVSQGKDIQMSHKLMIFNYIAHGMQVCCHTHYAALP